MYNFIMRVKTNLKRKGKEAKIKKKNAKSYHYCSKYVSNDTRVNLIKCFLVSNVCLLRFCRAIQPHTAPHPIHISDYNHILP